MKDMMMEVYNQLVANDLIKEKVTKERIKFYEVPESLDTSKPFIVIDTPLGPPTSAYYAANKEMSQIFSYQINVETTNRKLTDELSKEIKKIMWKNDFKQLSGGLDAYFTETKRFVQARRYRKNTKMHDTDY